MLDKKNGQAVSALCEAASKTKAFVREGKTSSNSGKSDKKWVSTSHGNAGPVHIGMVTYIFGDPICFDRDDDYAERAKDQSSLTK